MQQLNWVRMRLIRITRITEKGLRTVLFRALSEGTVNPLYPSFNGRQVASANTPDQMIPSSPSPRL